MTRDEPRRRTVESSEPRLAEILRTTPPSLLGMGLLYAWAWLAFLSPETLFHSEVRYVAVVRAAWTVAISVNLIIWFILLARRPAVDFSLVARRKLLVALAVLVPVGTLGASLITGDSLTDWILQLSCIGLAALGSTFFPILWQELYARLDTARATIAASASVILAVSLYFLVLALPSSAARIGATVVFPVVCMLLLARADKAWAGRQNEVAADVEIGAPEVKVSTTLALVPGGLGLAYGLILGAIDFLTGTQSSAAFSVLIGGAGAIALLGGAAIFARKFDFFQFTYRAVVPLVAVGIVLLPTGTPTAAAGLILGGFLVFDMVGAALMSELSRRLGIIPMRLILYSRAISHGGIFAGILLGRLVAGNGFMSGNQLLIASMMMLWMLVMALTYTLRSSESAQRIPAPAQAPESVCRSLAVKYRLSSREEEILELLVQGRSLPYIQKELYISLSTAKFHVTNIYTKFGVHTRQDLLDKVTGCAARTLRSETNGAAPRTDAEPRD